MKATKALTPSEMTQKAGLNVNENRTIRFETPFASFFRLCGKKGWEIEIMVCGIELCEKEEGKSYATIIYTKKDGGEENLLKYTELPTEAKKVVSENFTKNV